MQHEQFKKLAGKKILVTGGAGFIGSNLCEALLELEAKVHCLDNFSTGHRKNIEEFLDHSNFTLIEGDIRDLETCHKACEGVDYILHEAALGSVPRSINDPITSNDVNVSGFLNILVAARDAVAKRFVYAASSSTYGDSEKLPKVEDEIGKPLSPYAITKYVNELYADIFNEAYGLDTIGLRYFNVFGRKQDPNGAYAAVIPKFIIQLMNHESPVINGNGTYSRDFTYIDNVVQMNLLAITTENEEALNQVYNTAVGDRTNLLELTNFLKEYLAEFDPNIGDVEIKHGPNRVGDIAHSLASIKKGKKLLGYQPLFGIEEGLKEGVKWYWREFYSRSNSTGNNFTKRAN
ncbi:MAG: SDR family oxidoreductase [Christiangramia sp.]|nr:SDR family oxidoreductase [Christiangramia sp.]